MTARYDELFDQTTAVSLAMVGAWLNGATRKRPGPPQRSVLSPSCAAPAFRPAARCCVAMIRLRLTFFRRIVATSGSGS